MPNIGLHRFALFVAACTLVLVVAGGLVVSKEAGLSVPDWPLSYGQLMPVMEGGVFYEHGHRMIATLVGFLTIILAVWTQRVERRGWLKRLAWAALGLVIAQGLLGGMTVLFLLPPWVSISHACLAQIFFATIVSIALFTSSSWHAERSGLMDMGAPSARALAFTAPVFVLAQIALGAGYRHKVMGIMPHVLGAFVVTIVLIYFAIVVLTQYAQVAPLKRAATALLWITLFQVVLGVGAYFSRLKTADSPIPQDWMVVLTVAHVGTGALTFALTVLTAWQTLRHLAQPHEAVSQTRQPA